MILVSSAEKWDIFVLLTQFLSHLDQLAFLFESKLKRDGN